MRRVLPFIIFAISCGNSKSFINNIFDLLFIIFFNSRYIINVINGTNIQTKT